MLKKVISIALGCVLISTQLPAPPSIYLVHQQTGHENSCIYVSAINLRLLRDLRAKNEGSIVLKQDGCQPKWRSWVDLSETIHVADEAYTRCLEGSSDFKLWVERARLVSPLSFENLKLQTSIVENTLEFPWDSAQTQMFFPRLFKDRKMAELGPLKRGVPILQKDDRYYVREKENIFKKSSDASPFQAFTKGPQVFGDSHIMLSSKLPEKDQWEPFDEIGYYRLILLTLGVHRDHRPLSPIDSELKIFKALQMSIQESEHHPWKNLRSTDLLEIHMTALFKEYPSLKARVVSTIDFYFKPWALYTSFHRIIDMEGKPLREKYLPGENQMLAYYFSVMLKYLWAASIGDEALHAVMRYPMLGSFENREDFTKKRKEFLFRAQEMNSAGDSFLGVWTDLKSHLYELAKFAEFPEIIAFASHACVLSFDENLQEAQFQNHENRAVAEKLGFVIFDSLYDREFKPFYRLPGQAHHEMEFYEGEA